MAELLAAPVEGWRRRDQAQARLRAEEELAVCELGLVARLTWRELEVLRLARAGCKVAVIADRLGIAVETAKTHLKRARAKVKAAREQYREQYLALP